MSEHEKAEFRMRCVEQAVALLRPTAEGGSALALAEKLAAFVIGAAGGPATSAASSSD